MIHQPDAVGIGLLDRLDTLGRGHLRDCLLVARLESDVANHFHTGEVRVARNVVDVRLGVDQVSNGTWIRFGEPLFPTHGVDRLLWRVDHEDAIGGRHKARVTAPEVDLRGNIGTDFAHLQNSPCSVYCAAIDRASILDDRNGVGMN
jgi:hypothetical protein